INATGWILATHNRHHVITGCIQPRNWLSVARHDPCFGIRSDACEGTKRPGAYMHRIKGALFDWRQTRVWFNFRVATVTIEVGGAALEFWVLPTAGVSVKFLNSFGQLYRVDTGFQRKFFYGLGFDQILAADIRRRWDRGGFGKGQRIFAHKGGISDLPGFYRLVSLCGVHHPVNVIKITVGFINETFTVLTYSDL